MPLIKTIAEIRSVIPRISNLSQNAGLPNVEKAGRMHIVPIIGKELYQDINTRYNSSDGLSDAEKELLTYIQTPLAAYSLLDDLAFLHTTITDNGIRTASTDKLQAAHRWEYRELQNTLANYGADGIEMLLDYLYDNSETLPLWTGSAAYKEVNSFLIKSGIDFSKHYPLIQPLRTYWAIKPVMADVEENYLNATLGRDLFAWVKKQSDIIVTAESGEVDVLSLCKKAVVNLVIKHASSKMAVSFGEFGFTVLASGGSRDDASDGKVAASAVDVSRQREEAALDGQNYLTKAARYLTGIANGQFSNDWENDFTTAFDKSPLKKDPNKEPYTNGNERRKIFRMN